MTQRFQRAYDALIQAFFDGTLAKGTCTACAVGNIVAAAQGNKVVRRPDGKYTCIDGDNTWWGILFSTVNGEHKNMISSCPDMAELLRRLTGYSAEELALVEYAFEKNTYIDLPLYACKHERTILNDQYRGLCAVFEVLMRLDGITEIDPPAKLREHPKLILNH